jgi:hypothetical protein
VQSESAGLYRQDCFGKRVKAPVKALNKLEPSGYDWEKESRGCKWGAANSVIVEEWAGNLDYAFSIT